MPARTSNLVQSGMGFPGGKAGAGVYQRIINEIPAHDVYVEPFLGDGAIMRRKLPAARSIGIDLDRSTAAAFPGGAHGIEVHCCCGLEWLKYAFGLYRVDRPTPHPTTRADAVRSHDAGFSGPLRWFVYCDPPYLLSTRKSGRIYRQELSEPKHLELLDVITRLPCPVAISGYWSELYATRLQGWRQISFNAMTRGGKVAKEFLWMNYPPPAELHDYRYLGDNKRQRERVARKVRTWSAGLARLPQHERQAILRGLDPGAAAGSRDPRGM